MSWHQKALAIVTELLWCLNTGSRSSLISPYQAGSLKAVLLEFQREHMGHLGVLSKCRVRFSRTRVGSENLPFSQSPKWCWNCWSQDHAWSHQGLAGWPPWHHPHLFSCNRALCYCLSSSPSSLPLSWRIISGPIDCPHSPEWYIFFKIIML